MKKSTLVAFLAIITGYSAAQASEFSKNCYAQAEAAAVKFVSAKYHNKSVHGGWAMDGEGDDIHVQVKFGSKFVCVDVGVSVDLKGNCSLANTPLEIMDCRE